MQIDNMLKLLQIADLAQKHNLSAIHAQAIALIDEAHRASLPKEPEPEPAEPPIDEEAEASIKPSARRF